MLPISDNPVVNPHNPGIGQRIFADDDTPQDGVDRRLVRVTATLSQPIPNVDVYFRNFDLDDPTDDSIIDPLGNAGDDNNGMPRAGTLSMCVATNDGCRASTDASGVATIEFTVTRQPGDNFAIAAGVITSEVRAVNMNGIELTNGSGQNIPTTCSTELVCRSQMLTVWRRLHIEVDSMSESVQNFVLGRATQTVRIRVGQRVTIPISSTLEPNRFENGRLIINSRWFTVVSNTANTVDVVGRTSLATIFADSMFQLFDDDDFDDDDGALVDGDTGEDISEPPDSLLQPNDILCSEFVTSGCNVFASSYVRPVQDIISDTTDNGLFQSNIESVNTNPDAERAVFMVNFDQRATENDPEFWTIYLYGSYQQNLNRDADPSDEDGDGNLDGCPDASYGVVDAVGTGWGAAIHMEVGRPREYPNNFATSPVSRAWTAAHEIGHLFDGDHPDGGIMAPSCGRTGYEFDPVTIRRLRSVVTNP